MKCYDQNLFIFEYQSCCGVERIPFVANSATTRSELASGRAVVVVDGFMNACDKYIGSELDLTDVVEDNMVDFGVVRKNIKGLIGGAGVEPAKSCSDHYVIFVLVDQEIGLMQRPAKDTSQKLLELSSVLTSFSAVIKSGTILFSYYLLKRFHLGLPKSILHLPMKMELPPEY